jgi:hypothetical protein
MVLKHKYPFLIVEHKGFIDFLQTAQPKFVLPGQKTLRNNCVSLFLKLKSVKMAKLAKTNHISVTTDL